SFSSLFFTALSTSCLYTLSLHDALPILSVVMGPLPTQLPPFADRAGMPSECSSISPGSGATVSMPSCQMAPRHRDSCATSWADRSEEHTSELQSRGHLVCRLLLEKKKR